jgi:hypothetical protein
MQFELCETVAARTSVQLLNQKPYFSFRKLNAASPPSMMALIASDIWNINGTFAGNDAARLVTSCSIITPRHQLGIAIDHEIGIVACEQELRLGRKVSSPLGNKR